MCGQNRPPIAVTLALLMVLCAAGGASLVHAQQNDSYRTVARPTLASGPLCAEEKAALVSSAAAAQAAAAENAQIAPRRFADLQTLQKTGKITSKELDNLARERDQRLEEARQAFGALDQATRIAEKPCPAPVENTAPATKSAEKTPAAADPAKADAGNTASAKEPGDKPEVSLALTLTVPAYCKPASTCPMVVELHNRGSRPLASPFLVALALGSEGAQIGNILPDSWSCGQASESLTCSGAGTALAPDARARLSIDWQIAERPRRPSSTVCARIVWPARAKDGVYRSEQIAAIQFALQKAGFDPGGYDGRLGTKTVEAIRAFRSRANIEGPTELTADFLNAVFGSNGTLAGDDNAADDSACTSVSFGTPPLAANPASPPSAPVAVVNAPASPVVEAAPPPPEQPRLSPGPAAAPKRVAPREPRPRQQAAPQAEPRRQTARRAPVQADDDDDDVVVYTSPPRRTQPAGQRPVIVYPDGSYRRWGDPTVYRQ